MCKVYSRCEMYAEPALHSQASPGVHTGHPHCKEWEEHHVSALTATPFHSLLLCVSCYSDQHLRGLSSSSSCTRDVQHRSRSFLGTLTFALLGLLGRLVGEGGVTACRVHGAADAEDGGQTGAAGQ